MQDNKINKKVYN